METKNIGVADISLEISTPSINIDDKTIRFEKLLPGKDIRFVHNITSRIDHSLSASHTIAIIKSIENAFSVEVTPKTKELRDLMLIAELLKSHNEYLHTKIIPKIFKTNDFFEFAQKNKKDHKRYHNISSNLSEFLRIIGGRYPHPISPIIGGFVRIPNYADKEKLLAILKNIRGDVEKVSEFILKNSGDRFDIDMDYVSLSEIDSVPLEGKNIICNDELVDIKDYIDNFDSAKNMVGPISRISNNNKLFESKAEKIIKRLGLKFPLNNIYTNRIAMAIEMINFLYVAIDMLSGYDCEMETAVSYISKKSVGYSAVESPKGTLFYKLNLDKQGKITKARIISNIGQNHLILSEAIKKLPLDYDKKTRKQILEEIESLVDAFYL